MAKKKTQKDNHVIKLSQANFTVLNQLATEELNNSRYKFATIYNRELTKNNDPNLALKKAEKESPISISYNYTVVNTTKDEKSDEIWTEILVDDDDGLKKIENLFGLKSENNSSEENLNKKENNSSLEESN